MLHTHYYTTGQSGSSGGEVCVCTSSKTNPRLFAITRFIDQVYPAYNTHQNLKKCNENSYKNYLQYTQFTTRAQQPPSHSLPAAMAMDISLTSIQNV